MMIYVNGYNSIVNNIHVCMKTDSFKFQYFAYATYWIRIAHMRTVVENLVQLTHFFRFE